MLSFITEFPIDHSRDTSAFLWTIRKWILGSPHTCLKEDDFTELVSAGPARIQKANEGVEALGVVADSDHAAGVRYTRRDADLEWITTVVFSRTARDSWVGIRVSCESNHPAVRLPPAKKPVLVRTLLKELGGGADGEIRVGGSPLRLADADIELAGRLIVGKAGCRLPIVYVSAGFQGNYIVDADRLANDLSGMAHVVVEPNRPFSLRLQIEVDSENVYGGTVGIYWPDGGGRRSFFIGREFESPTEVANAIFDEVRSALVNRRGLDRCTWASIQEAVSRQAIQALRASGSQEVEKYIETFDTETKAKDERLKEAEREIERLKAELRIYEARLSAKTGGLLRAGSEQDLYPNEVLSILRLALEDAVSHVPQDSRRQHVLTAILDANPVGDDVAGHMREKLKDLLKGSRGMDAKIRRGLDEMGFSIAEDGKHYKLVFRDDDRYTFTLPRSGSDHRGGLNAASDIGRLLF